MVVGKALAAKLAIISGVLVLSGVLIYGCRPNEALGSIPASWEDVNAIVPYRTHGVEGTFILLRHGASLLRLPDKDEDFKLDSELLQAIGFPESHGICLAIPDLFTRGNMIRLRSDLTSSVMGEDTADSNASPNNNNNPIETRTPSSQNNAALNVQPDSRIPAMVSREGLSHRSYSIDGLGKASGVDGLGSASGTGKNSASAVVAERSQMNSEYLRKKKGQVERILPPIGRYCNSLVTDQTFWNPEFLSTFELLNRWRNFIAEQTGILMIVGPENPPSEKNMERVFPTESAMFAAAQYVKGKDPGADASELLPVIQQLVQEQKLSLVLILGTSVSYATNLGLNLHCVVPVVDGGTFNIFPNEESHIVGLGQQQIAEDSSDRQREILGGNHITWRLLTRNYEGLEMYERVVTPEKGAESNTDGGILGWITGKTALGSAGGNTARAVAVGPGDNITEAQRFETLRKTPLDVGANLATINPDTGESEKTVDLSRYNSRTKKEFVVNTQSFGNYLEMTNANAVADANEAAGASSAKPASSAQALSLVNTKATAIQREVAHEHRFHPEWTRKKSSGVDTRIVQSLNGPWEFYVIPTKMQNATIENDDTSHIVPLGNITVPFAPQSSLSQLQIKVSADERVYYRSLKPVKLDSKALKKEKEEYRLVIDACDWQCSVYINGEMVGEHRGGYDSWYVPIPEKFHDTDLTVIITAWDPTDEQCEFVQTPPVPCIDCCKIATQPRGKQALNPGFIMYTPVTGLWKNGLWIEKAQICSLRDIQWNYNSVEKKFSVFGMGLRDEECYRQYPWLMSLDESQNHLKNWELHVVLTDTETRTVIGKGVKSGLTHPSEEHSRNWKEQRNRIEIDLKNLWNKKQMREWDVHDPYLYNLDITLIEKSTSHTIDSISRPVGLRELHLKKNQLYLNGRMIFIHGVLHQGYWPESLLTPPNEESIWQEVRAMKQAGFNTVRVHMVIFPSIFYYACDNVGLMVIQDMPSGDGRVIPAWDMHRKGKQKNQDDNVGFDEIVRSNESRTQFMLELKAMIMGLRMFSSVVIWVIFNEGWGQSNTIETVQWVRRLDPTRLIDAVSGWNDPVLFGEPHPIVEFYLPDKTGDKEVDTSVETQWLYDIGDFFDIHNYEGAPFQNLSSTFDVYPFPIANRPILVGEYGGIGYSLSESHEYDADASWGYGNVKRSNQGFFEAVEAVYDRLLKLACKLDYNTVGGVYTQWTDVETEINGLVTYDRVPKFSLNRMGILGRSLIDSYMACRTRRWWPPAIVEESKSGL